MIKGTTNNDLIVIRSITIYGSKNNKPIENRRQSQDIVL